MLKIYGMPSYVIIYESYIILITFHFLAHPAYINLYMFLFYAMSAAIRKLLNTSRQPSLHI